MQTMLTFPEVMKITGYSRSSIYRKMQEKTFPQPIKLGPCAVRWFESDIADWINSLAQDSRKKPY